MSNVKYIIGSGNCRPGIGEDIKKPVPSEAIRADNTTKTADNTILTADYSQ